jgi:TATA-box binding protein (TBP) (component of TFIID and TFIIIB)
MTPVIHNIKMHVCIRKRFIPKIHPKRFTATAAVAATSDVIMREYHNFYTVKGGRFVYIMYYSSGYCNVTGIKSMDLIDDVMSEVGKTFGVPRRALHNAGVDNICASGTLATGRVNIYKIHTYLQGEPQLQLTSCHDINIFPGLFIRCRRKRFTISLFQSGKYCIVGANSIEVVSKAFEILTSIVEEACVPMRR